MARDKQVVSKTMKRVKSKDTSIELVLRKALWKKGIHYRKNDSVLPGKPDIVISKYKIVIFCDGEFFHGKDWDNLKLQLERGNNSEYWIKKIERNRQRDQDNDKKLIFLGWKVIHFWGKDIVKNTDECVKTIEEMIFDSYIDDEKNLNDIFVD